MAARIVVPRRWTWAWRVEEVLGVARARRALRAIERGEVAEEHFAAVGDAWDVEERTWATLDRLGLDHLELDRRLGELSGGEAVLLGLAAQLLRRPGCCWTSRPTTSTCATPGAWPGPPCPMWAAAPCWCATAGCWSAALCLCGCATAWTAATRTATARPPRSQPARP